MTAPGGPPRPGRHSSGDTGPGAGEPSGRAGASIGDGFPPGPGRAPADVDATAPMLDPGRRAQASADRAGDDGADGHGFGRQHPSGPLPPMPTGAWSRLRPRDDGDDDATVAAPYLNAHPDDDSAEDAPEPAGALWDDETGGLDVIGANVDDERPRRRGLRRLRRAVPPPAADELHGEPHEAAAHAGHGLLGRSDDPVGHAPVADDQIPVEPYDSGSERRRRRRRPFAVILALLVLSAIVVGIVLGGQRLLGLLDPTARDYDGAGTGSVDVRVEQGDTLSDIARTLEEADVIASTAPFVAAAQDNPDATGIQPGVYGLRLQMSGAAALELLLDPASRQVSRVTVPEGLTVEATLARIAEDTGIPIEELEAAAGDPAALGVPAYANGQLEGFLFPATYDTSPDDTAVDVLRRMVAQFTEIATRLELEQRAAAAGRSPAEVVTVASMVQSETRLDEERPDVAQVIYNRLDQGIPLGIDATLAFGLDKNGNELTVTDLRTDSPYNTRTRQGLPPTPISSPGEASLEAALAPSTGELLYYVLETAEGRHFFTSDYAEFQAARQRCAEAGLGCGG